MRTNANVAAQNIKFYKDIGGLLVCKGIRIRFRKNLKHILTNYSLVTIHKVALATNVYEEQNEIGIQN